MSAVQIRYRPPFLPARAAGSRVDPAAGGIGPFDFMSKNPMFLNGLQMLRKMTALVI
jgi:hypothetical protein